LLSIQLIVEYGFFFKHLAVLLTVQSVNSQS